MDQVAMATITWRGNSGIWASPVSWQGFRAPGSLDTALFGTSDISAATIDSPVAVGSLALLAGTSAMLLVRGRLELQGVLSLGGGTLALSAGGTITGGTVDATGLGTLLATGGVADGVVWLGGLGRGLAITSATAAATQAITDRLAVAGALTLEAGTFASSRFAIGTFATGPASITVRTGATVTLDAGSSLVASADDPQHRSQVPPNFAGLDVGGAGTLVNAGLITSDLSSIYAALTIEPDSFVNAGTFELNTSIIPRQQITFLVTLGGRFPQPVTLTFDQTLTPGLTLRGASVVNSGRIIGQAASVLVQGASFLNTGLISLGAARAQMPFHDTVTAFVETVTIGSSIDFATSVVDFSNTGTIAAGTIEFDGDLTLARLGTVRGQVLFKGTLDLQGGTLDAGRLNPGGTFVFSGTVRDGTLLRDGGSLVTTDATLVGVTMLDQAPGVLLDVLSGQVTLNAATTELAYTTAARVDSLDVTAGLATTVHRIGARAAGILSFGAGTLIRNGIAGSTLEIGGQGIFRDDGRIELDGAILAVVSLDGGGTVSLANGAELAIGALEPTSSITVEFQSGNNLLSLPTGASGVNALGLILAGLRSGDLIDFAGVSSFAGIGGLFGVGAAAVQDGVLNLQGASGEQARVALADDGAGLVFSVAPDQTGGTLVTVSCFRRGTRVAVPGGEALVERLRIGDLVLNARGEARPVKWLGRRAYPAHVVAAQSQVRPVRLAPGSLGPGRPRRPLFLSPLHAVLLHAPDGEGVLVPAGALVGCRGIARAPVAAVSYLHVELDTPDAVLAEGVAAETFVDRDSRRLFRNAAEYARLYPAETRGPADFPARRVEDGWLLEAIRAALGAPPLPDCGGLRWHIDQQSDALLEGWATRVSGASSRGASGPVELELLAGAAQVGCIVANRYRVDLDRAGLGGGRCAFQITSRDTPVPLAAIRLRSLADGTELTH